MEILLQPIELHLSLVLYLVSQFNISLQLLQLFSEFLLVNNIINLLNLLR